MQLYAGRNARLRDQDAADHPREHPGDLLGRGAASSRSRRGDHTSAEAEFRDVLAAQAWVLGPVNTSCAILSFGPPFIMPDTQLPFSNASCWTGIFQASSLPDRGGRQGAAPFRPRRPDRRPDHPRPVTCEDIIECRSERAVPVTNQEPEPPGPLAEVHQEVASLLGSPRTCRMGGHAQDVHGPGLEFHHE